ncbi:MAG: SDR family oxidoreductase [Chloroflexota bacterium]
MNILITGTSSGIGYDAARYLIERGHRVFGSVRKAEDAERVQAELGDQFTPLVFDVTNEVEIKTAVSHLKQHLAGEGLDGLVNNAGIATPGPLQYLPLDELRKQLEVNVVGVTAVTQACLPLLGAKADSKHPPGRIVNISSVSGQIAYPFMGAYAASKHALEALSDAWRRELMMFGIDVILIEPGTVQTPIIGKFQGQIERYLGTEYGRFFQPMTKEVAKRSSNNLPVEKISMVIDKALTTSNPKTRYPIPRRWLTGWLLPRWLPDRWFDQIAARRLGLKK